MLEEVKTLRISFEELTRRMTYENKEEYLNMIDKYGGIVLLIPHYANFEWINPATFRYKYTSLCTIPIWTKCSNVSARASADTTCPNTPRRAK